MIKKRWLYLISLLFIIGCDPKDPGGNTDPEQKEVHPPYTTEEFVMGVDLSYLNQIIDQGGVYADQMDPYSLFADMKANVARLRLWHNPDWVQGLYDGDNPLYSGYPDAERILEAGMDFCLDFHYSDNWADPGKQHTPAAWKDLNLNQLTDSVYQYTYAVLDRLKSRGLSPTFVQIGNEINPGMLHPLGHRDQNEWKNLGQLINSGIAAVNAVFGQENRPEIILHIAQPENIRWFFTNLTISGVVTDFDIIGVSYYPIWSTVDLLSIEGYLNTAINDFNKKLMIMETAFPWTSEGADDYTNIIGGMDSLGGYPVTKQGQLDFMTDLCQKVIDAGGKGVFYWEPGWITSNMNTQWGTGSAWENCSFFDFQDNNSVLPVVQYLTKQYEFQP
jgi:arabinogalactan endo-1,4-beta-galactosidase